MATNLCDLVLEPSGDLRLVLTASGEQEIGELVAVQTLYGFDEAFGRLLEQQLANGWELIRPEELAALTSTPILSESVERNEDGELVAVGTVYWFPAYETRDLIADLAAGRPVIFSGVDE